MLRILTLILAFALMADNANAGTSKPNPPQEPIQLGLEETGLKGVDEQAGGAQLR